MFGDRSLGLVLDSLHHSDILRPDLGETLSSKKIQYLIHTSQGRRGRR